MNLSQSFAQYLPYISVAIALIALLVSVRSSGFARRALAMSEADFQDKRLPLTIYLIQGLRIRKNGYLYASFAVTITNGSTVPETLTRIDLRIFFKDVSDRCGSTIVESENEPVVPHGAFCHPGLKRPLNLSARSSESGWISFKIPQIVIMEKLIEKYQVCGQNSAGKETTLDAYVLSDVTQNE